MRVRVPLYFQNSRKKMKGVEEKIAATILEDPVEITVGGKQYKAARPTLGTLIEVSRQIAGHLPDIPPLQNDMDALQYTLAYAAECGVIGRVVAVLILGRRGIRKARRFLGITIRRDNVGTLARALEEEYSNRDLSRFLRELLSAEEIAFFLDIITTLHGANMLRRTRQTVSGQQC